LESRLGGHEWLVGADLTAADIACYPYAALAHEAGLPIESYSGIVAWIARIRDLPGYVGMPGQFAPPVRV
jgi:glutathione S-transferase